MKLSVWAMCAVALTGSGATLADVYQYRDSFGHVYLTDRPMSGAYKLVKVTRLPGGSSRPPPLAKPALVDLQRRRLAVEPVVAAVAKDTRLRPELLHAVIRAESAYDPQAVSSKGAAGLMQLMPGTAERYGVQDRHDPQQNVRGGASYLRDLLSMFDNDLRLALAAYNAGENAVIKYGRQIPPYPETQHYVEKVMAFLAQPAAPSNPGRLAQN